MGNSFQMGCLDINGLCLTQPHTSSEYCIANTTAQQEPFSDISLQKLVGDTLLRPSEPPAPTKKGTFAKITALRDQLVFMFIGTFFFQRNSA